MGTKEGKGCSRREKKDQVYHSRRPGQLVTVPDVGSRNRPENFANKGSDSVENQRKKRRVNG